MSKMTDAYEEELKSKQEVPNYQKYLLNSKKGENEKNEK